MPSTEFSNARLHDFLEVLKPYLSRPVICEASHSIPKPFSEASLKQWATKRTLSANLVGRVLQAVKAALRNAKYIKIESRKELSQEISLKYGMALEHLTTEIFAADYEPPPQDSSMPKRSDPFAKAAPKLQGDIRSAGQLKELLDRSADKQFIRQQGAWVTVCVNGSTAARHRLIKIVVLRSDPQTAFLQTVLDIIEALRAELSPPLLVVARGDKLFLVDWRNVRLAQATDEQSEALDLTTMKPDEVLRRVRSLGQSYAADQLAPGEVGVTRIDVAGNPQLLAPYNLGGLALDILSVFPMVGQLRTRLLNNLHNVFHGKHVDIGKALKVLRLPRRDSWVEERVKSFLMDREGRQGDPITARQLALGCHVVNDMESNDLSTKFTTPFDSQTTYGLARLIPVVPTQVILDQIDKLSNPNTPVQDFERRALFAGYVLRLLDHRYDDRVERAAHQFVKRVIPNMLCQAKVHSIQRRIDWWTRHIGLFNLARIGHAESVKELNNELERDNVAKTLIAIDCAYYPDESPASNRTLDGRERRPSLPVKLHFDFSSPSGLDAEIWNRGKSVVDRLKKNLDFHISHPLVSPQFKQYFELRCERATDAYKQILAA